MFNRFFITAILVSSLSLPSCAIFKSGSTEQSRATDVITTLTAAVSVADAVCAQWADENHDAQLASDCATAYDRARTQLILAQKSLDEGNADLACKVKFTTEALKDFRDVIKARTGGVPSVLTVAVAVGEAFGASCK